MAPQQTLQVEAYLNVILSNGGNGDFANNLKSAKEALMRRSFYFRPGSGRRPVEHAVPARDGERQRTPPCEEKLNYIYSLLEARHSLERLPFAEAGIQWLGMTACAACSRV